MGNRDNDFRNEHLGDCDICGFTFHASELRKTWDNMYVCKDDFEVRHPGDFVRGVKDNTAPAWVRHTDYLNDTNGQDISGNPIVTNIRPDVNGDITKNLAPTDHNTQIWNTVLTAGRAANLSALNAKQGDRVIIYRTGVDTEKLFITTDVLIAGTTEIEAPPEEFHISNDTTFNGLGITYGVDIALNTGTGEAFTILSSADADTLLLDGIFGVPPQQYSVQKVVATVDIPSVVELRFNGTEWVIVDTTRLGL